MRHSGAEALRLIDGDTATAWLESLLDDPDGRVAASAFGALAASDSVRAQRRARGFLDRDDPVVRTVAANLVAQSPTVRDIDALIAGYARAIDDPIPDARVAAVRALGAVAGLGDSPRLAVEERLLGRFPTGDGYLVRRAAEEHLPGVAARWGPPYPTVTGRNIEDYRELARRLLLPAERGEFPEIVIESDRGRITIRLFAADAPVTVNALLELVDRAYFDNGVWHRVVPNFVIQDGDPRGDGWGGPGVTLRDEINRRRYGRGTVGMALAGPDTGGSQFFITHSAQPHLDGTYTVIGQVEAGLSVVDRTTQGDRIRSIRRR